MNSNSSKPMSNPLVSVIMADAGFRERTHLVDSLRRQTLPADRFEMLWLDYYDRTPVALENIPNLETVTLGRTDRPYHMSVCFNEGIRRSRGEIVVIPDADVVAPPDLLESIVTAHQACPELVMYIRRWDEPEARHTGDVGLDHLQRHCVLVNPTNYGGCLSVRRRWLERVDGYEEDPLFAGLSANARDLFTRLTNLGLHIRWHPAARVYHPWHPGTQDPDPRYARQHRVIRARARSLETLPVKGLNPALPRPYRTVYDEVPGLARADLSGLLSRIRQVVRILVRGG